MRGHDAEVFLVGLMMVLIVFVLIVIPVGKTNDVIKYEENIIKEAEAYSQQYNVDLDGETVFDVYNLLIKEGIVENDKSEKIISELCYTQQNTPRKLIKIKETGGYTVVPTINYK